ncbi:hypothetical protein tinsulaeT_28190 [Thalassotalea insulae]|uniref:Uncharacterized protein n=1 Tax=Thalassotalea insulae TaxID=2056778 RepID=A0ABQ6GW93_9GAMM|nr:hypothetical protein [Thalassotalea insulae]GLX79479.1 hypothetical protein tinsulaeT_28190 [Thalassotalea insulae]
MSNFSGYILNINAPNPPDMLGYLAGLPGMRNPKKIGDTNWCFLVYTSSKAILEDDEVSESGLYEYRILARWGGESFIFAAQSKDISDILIHKLLGKSNLSIFKQGINIDSFVRQIMEEPNHYSFKYLHVKCFAWGTSLNSMSLFGEDITASNLLRENSKLFNFTTCGVSEITSSKETVRIGTKGTLSLTLGSIQREKETQLTTIDKILRYLKINELYTDKLS